MINGGYAELLNAYVMFSQPIFPNTISRHKALYFKFDGKEQFTKFLQAYNISLSHFSNYVRDYKLAFS